MTHDQAIAMRTLYIDAGEAAGLPADCCVVAVPPLLRALILRAIEIGLDYGPKGPEARVMAVILDELRALRADIAELRGQRD